VGQRSTGLDWTSCLALDLFAQGGAIGITTLTDEGNRTFTPLKRIRTTRHRDKDGTYRWYNHHRLPDHLGGGELTVRLHGNDVDKARRFNRPENVRPIPQTDPDFAGLYKRRNDAESINRALDDTMWLRRAHTVGHQRQHLNPLTRPRRQRSRRAPAPAQQRPTATRSSLTADRSAGRAASARLDITSR